MKNIFRNTLAGLALLASVGLVAAQNGFFNLWPIVGSASYSCGSVNGVSNCSVPAGPSVLSGSENIPANTNLSGGRAPQNVLIGMASLNALPITVQVGTISGSNTVTAAATSGGVFLSGPAILSGATITLPPSPIDGQQFVFSSNRNITTLVITGANNVAANTTPTAFTASTTAPQGYKFFYNAAAALWYRLQ